MKSPAGRSSVNRPFGRLISEVFAGPNPLELVCQYRKFKDNSFSVIDKV
jgi:hypothetical protein